jgi:hypothetical protein
MTPIPVQQASALELSIENPTSHKERNITRL